jgi:hydrogenase expression/formation protein HypC
MCIGIPMRVIEGADGMALCEGRGQRERLNLMLVGEQPAGTWVLAFQGSAVRVLSPAEAAASNDALDALASVLAGGDASDGFFADLVGREPQLPEHLRGNTP